MKDGASNAELKAYLAEKKVQTDEEKYAAIADFAAAKGCQVTVEDISLAMAGCREMDPEEMEHVAGGWCLWSDACDKVINYHKEHDDCHTTYKTFEDCSWNDRCQTSTIIYCDYGYKV